MSSRVHPVEDGGAQVLTPRDARLQFAELILKSPAPVLVMSGPELRIDMINPPYVQCLRRGEACELLGKPMREALPELEGQGYFELLEEVFRTGKSYVGREVLCKLALLPVNRRRATSISSTRPFAAKTANRSASWHRPPT